MMAFVKNILTLDFEWPPVFLFCKLESQTQGVDFKRHAFEDEGFESITRFALINNHGLTDI